MRPCERRVQSDSTSPRRLAKMPPYRKLQDLCDAGSEQSYAEEWVDDNGEVQTCTPTFTLSSRNVGKANVIASFCVVVYVVSSMV
mmetsp:Transcript_376/g.603  ORF Transcript_376/g.603 Transcript_376/m.603 type:complete len:85 (-) Transcript_376:61-315(-)